MSDVVDSEPLWINDPAILVKNNNYRKILPYAGITRNATINMFTRIIVYLVLIFLVIAFVFETPAPNANFNCQIRKNNEDIYWMILFVVIALTALFVISNRRQNIVYIKTDNTEKNTDDVSQPHTKSIAPDPSLNPYQNPTMEPFLETVVPERAEELTPANLPFYTVPNDQNAFAKWAYASEESCKLNPKKCRFYESPRHTRYNPRE